MRTHQPAGRAYAWLGRLAARGQSAWAVHTHCPSHTYARPSWECLPNAHATLHPFQKEKAKPLLRPTWAALELMKVACEDS
ncbi:Hypothetical predicted protein [Olea europaea subsp. europaea]|uniref:Uncharacterized protein n=1 Tax=Olea europaea subsp. europaea TaxID=158383 RepID=A0A8S0R581_OLEEU|nr:Hypothetical predicted protein [Olea europaea subsp. europaea]